jgi:hypothetical protein
VSYRQALPVSRVRLVQRLRILGQPFWKKDEDLLEWSHVLVNTIQISLRRGYITMKTFAPVGAFIVVLMLFQLNPGTAAAHHTGQGIAPKRTFTKHFQHTLFDITNRAEYSVEVLLDDKEYNIGKNVIGIVVHNAYDEDVKGAQLTIVYKNLATNELAPDKLSVKDNRNGLYIISGLDLRRKGRWELHITVKKGGVEDSVKFVLPDALNHILPKGEYSP